ncbi:UNVERIFIED_CONTAM: hypothetical protein K2H54_027239 [Gekko kuhli]
MFLGNQDSLRGLLWTLMVKQQTLSSISEKADGRKPFPINHGQSSDSTFLEDAIEVCKKFMERDPDELRFNAIALSAA